MAYQDDEITAIIVSTEEDIDQEAVEVIADLMAAEGIVSIQLGSHDEVQAQYERYGTIH